LALNVHVSPSEVITRWIEPGLCNDRLGFGRRIAPLEKMGEKERNPWKKKSK
jgi:hypothetical protein